MEPDLIVHALLMLCFLFIFSYLSTIKGIVKPYGEVGWLTTAFNVVTYICDDFMGCDVL